MKKNSTAILLARMLLAGCEAAPAPASETTSDIDATIFPNAASLIMF